MKRGRRPHIFVYTFSMLGFLLMCICYLFVLDNIFSTSQSRWFLPGEYVFTTNNKSIREWKNLAVTTEGASDTTDSEDANPLELSYTFTHFATLEQIHDFLCTQDYERNLINRTCTPEALEEPLVGSNVMLRVLYSSVSEATQFTEEWYTFRLQSDVGWYVREIQTRSKCYFGKGIPWWHPGNLCSM